MVFYRPVELAALTGQVDFRQKHLSGNPTYQEPGAAEPRGSTVHGSKSREISYRVTKPFSSQGRAGRQLPV